MESRIVKLLPVIGGLILIACVNTEPLSVTTRDAALMPFNNTGI
jgi:hypothetical protein